MIKMIKKEKLQVKPHQDTEAMHWRSTELHNLEKEGTNAWILHITSDGGGIPYTILMVPCIYRN